MIKGFLIIFLTFSPVLTIAGYLKGANLINFTHSCRKLYHLFNDEVFWKRKLKIENLIVSKHVKAFINFTLETKAFTKSIPVAKLQYLVLQKIYRNWKASTIESPPIQDLNQSNTLHNQFYTGLQNNHYFKLSTRIVGKSFYIEIKNLFGNIKKPSLQMVKLWWGDQMFGYWIATLSSHIGTTSVPL